MHLRKNAAIIASGIALTVLGLGAPAHAAAPTAGDTVQTRATIKCAPENKDYTVGSKITPVRSGPSDRAAQTDVVYPGNRVHGYYNCINGGRVFVCIGICSVGESGIKGRWVFRGALN